MDQPEDHPPQPDPAMDLGVEALVTDPNQLLWVGLQPNSINAQFISQGGPFALMDLQGANLTRALALLADLQFADHSGIGTMCSEIALAAHADVPMSHGLRRQP